jgi:hypothetical protein
VSEKQSPVHPQLAFINFSVAIKIVLAPHFSIGVFIPKSVFNIYTHTAHRGEYQVVNLGQICLGPAEKVLFPGKEQ